MMFQNRLKELLFSLGIKSMIPSENLLKEKLGGMTPHRFNQILNNDSKKELSLLEISMLQRWLSEVTGKPENTIALLVVPAPAVTL
jgi:hypothetical protein